MESNPNKFKFCDIGKHSVPTLFHARKTDRPSCCLYCYQKPPIKRSGAIQPKSRFLQRAIKVEPINRDDKSIPDLLSALELVFNRWIRNRDKGENGYFYCACCGAVYPNEEMDAGHMFAKTFSALRFDEDNVHGQAQKCNRMLNGNEEQFKSRIKEKIGLKRFYSLEARKHDSVKWEKETILSLIKKYK